MIPPIDVLRAEHQQQVIGPQLADLLAQVVRATAPKYPPSEYSDARVWNKEALEDALQEWVEIRLLRRNDLAALLARSTSSRGLLGGLTTSFSQFLINRRPRTSASNLFKRTQVMLETEGSFVAVGHGPKAASQHWTLVDAPQPTLSELSIRELVALAAELSNDELAVIRYGPYSLKSSPILREPNLRRLLIHLLGKSNGTMTLGQIAEVIRRRFGLYEFEPEELDSRLASSGQDLVRTVERRDLARRVLANLHRPVIDALICLHAAGGDLSSAASSLAVPEHEVARRVKVAMEIIAKFAETPEEAIEVYRLLESRFKEGGDV